MQVTGRSLVFTAATIIFWLLLFCPHPQRAAEKLNSNRHLSACSQWISMFKGTYKHTRTLSNGAIFLHSVLIEEEKSLILKDKSEQLLVSEVFCEPKETWAPTQKQLILKFLLCLQENLRIVLQGYCDLYINDLKALYECLWDRKRMLRDHFTQNSFTLLSMSFQPYINCLFLPLNCVLASCFLPGDGCNSDPSIQV